MPFDIRLCWCPRESLWLPWYYPNYSVASIVHVGLGLGELHLVHALAGVPVQESFTPEHGGELVTDTLE
jgi:hypothetical protein